MGEPLIVILPAVTSVNLSVNPVRAGGETVVTVTVVEKTKTLYPEERYLGEFQAGE